LLDVSIRSFKALVVACTDRGNVARGCCGATGAGASDEGMRRRVGTRDHGLAVDPNRGVPFSEGAIMPTAPPPGRDTATGTDPDAKYATPGYEDKSFGQAGNEDQELVDQLMDESDGDLASAEAAFDEQSAGAPALAAQDADADR
jgi:hypothetical protein